MSQLYTNRFTQAEVENMLTYLYGLYKQSQPTQHIADKDNPHDVTLVQVGAAPASVATDLVQHVVNTDNPHQVTAEQLGIDPGTLAGHAARTDNPHATTAAQVSADPVGTAATLLAGHSASGNPHIQYALDAALTAETNGRMAADSAEINTRYAADNAEASARALADANHNASSSVHNVGIVAGLNEVQTLTNKTILTPVATTAVGLTLSTQSILKVTAACTIVLPTAVGITGRIYVIDSAHTGTTTVNPTGAETIEGETTQTMVGGGAMTLYSDGSNWRIA